MARKVREELRQADVELRRFILYQYNESRRLGYPRLSTFARDIARGDIGTAPPTQEDPMMESMGEFYWGLLQIDRRILAEKYLETGTLYERARRCGITTNRYQIKVEKILIECKGWIRRADARMKMAA
jgi:hypothetical protein